MNGFRTFIWPFLLARVVMKDSVSTDVANRTAAVAALSASNPAASLLVAQEKKNDELEKQNLIATNVELQKLKIDVRNVVQNMQTSLNAAGGLSTAEISKVIAANVFTSDQVDAMKQIADENKYKDLSDALSSKKKSGG